MIVTLLELKQEVAIKTLAKVKCADTEFYVHIAASRNVLADYLGHSLDVEIEFEQILAWH